jgi:hypothetical protein
MDRLVREAIEIQLHPDNFNRDDGFNLSQSESSFATDLAGQPGLRLGFEPLWDS